MAVQHIAVGDKNITVIDTAYEYYDVINIEQFALNSYFKVTGSDYADGRASTFTGSYNLCSLYSQEDIDKIGVLTKNETVKGLVGGRSVFAAKLHLLKPYDICAPHIDGSLETYLYYVNAKWDITYGGHTLFFNESLDKVEYTSLFTPNRVVWFDGSIPHMGTPPTAATKTSRLVLALHFKKEGA